MDRRDFLKDSLLTWGALRLSSAVATAMPSAKKASGRLQIQYIREKIPSFEIPPYRGRSYDDNVPDTLDLAERAKLGVHVLTSITDPEADCEIYWGGDFFRNPAVIFHDCNDWVQNQEGLLEALPLLRHATGDSLNSQVDPIWMSTTLKSIGPDGLFYIPLNGRPWSRLNWEPCGLSPVWRRDGTTIDFMNLSESQVANTSVCPRIIGAMIVYYLRDQNPMWKETIRKMIGRLSELAIQRGDYCYYPTGSFEANAKLSPQAPILVGSTLGVDCISRLAQGLSQFYRIAGDEQALELAGKIVRYTRYHGRIFTPQGVWLVDPEAKDPKLNWPPGWEGDRAALKYGGHGSGHGHGLLSVLEYATAVKDRDLMEFCKSGYEWGRNPGPDFGVSTLVGWFPEVYLPNYRVSEGCAVALMLSLAVKLTEAGVGDYWDDVDRWVRNHFAEAQLTDVSWVDRIANGQPKKPVTSYESADHAADRSIGAFAGSAPGNDWGSGDPMCCTGNCTRAIYYVWESMIEYSDSQLQINLLLNRASRWADVYSYIPYVGRVDLKMKQDCQRVRMRVPEWIEGHSPDLTCKINGALRPVRWEGRYANIGAAKTGDVVSVTFPIAERTVKERIGLATYTLRIKGNTVISIDPPGENVPLYRGREKYRNEVRWVPVKRFVPEEELRW